MTSDTQDRHDAEAPAPPEQETANRAKTLRRGADAECCCHRQEARSGERVAAERIGRRAVIRAMAGAGCIATTTGYLIAGASVAYAERSSKAQAGDELVYSTGDKEGQLIAPADLEVGQLPVLAYPRDPATKQLVVSRASLLLLMRLKESDLDATMKGRSAEGIVAYSGVCTHEGCPITNNNDTHRMAVCNCHGSTFDLGSNGKVVHGPASRKLASIPVKIAEGAVIIAGTLDGPIGPPE